MDAITPSATYDELDVELDLDVSFVESGLEVSGVHTEDCTSDNCGNTTGPNC